MSTAVKSDVTADAVREILGEIERMRREEIGEDELTLATSYLDGVFPIRYETTAAIAAALAEPRRSTTCRTTTTIAIESVSAR